MNGIPGTHPKRSRRVRLTAVVSAAALATALTGVLASQAQAATPTATTHSTAQAATTATVTLHGKTYHVSLAKPTGIMPMNSSKSHETQAGRHATGRFQQAPRLRRRLHHGRGGPLDQRPQPVRLPLPARLLSQVRGLSLRVSR